MSLNIDNIIAAKALSNEIKEDINTDVVHKSGDETIAGEKTFTGDIISQKGIEAADGFAATGYDATLIPNGFSGVVLCKTGDGNRLVGLTKSATGVITYDPVKIGASIGGVFSQVFNSDGTVTFNFNVAAPNLPYGTSVYGGSLVTDTNSVNRNGFYSCLGTATSVPNVNYSWNFIHMNSNQGTTSAYQRWVAVNSTPIIYERLKTNSTWGAFTIVNAKDTVPTSGSVNPLTSGGAFTALQGLSGGFSFSMAADKSMVVNFTDPTTHEVYSPTTQSRDTTGQALVATTTEMAEYMKTIAEMAR